MICMEQPRQKAGITQGGKQCGFITIKYIFFKREKTVLPGGVYIVKEPGFVPFLTEAYRQLWKGLCCYLLPEVTDPSVSTQTLVQTIFPHRSAFLLSIITQYLDGNFDQWPSQRLISYCVNPQQLVTELCKIVTLGLNIVE